MKHVNLKPEFERSLLPPPWEVWPGAHELEDNRSSNPLSTDQSSSSALESPAEDTHFSVSTTCPAPICRQFWKAGNYDDVLSSNSRIQNNQNHLHVHPKFLHSNATSHKWAFGAIAELLDNGIDEIQHGATFVCVDKILNARDGSPALLIQDDGSGMNPEAIRRCMSFGFSDKKSESAIGQYGNGFKTGTMRLGADVIVFSRHLENRTLTQSIGLLSYTLLSRKGLNRIVVPMVDYEYNALTSTFEPAHRYDKEHFQSIISIFLQWSPYSSELALMKQFDDIGSHGTKVIVYNLWFTNEGTLEFDFESDHEDIRLPGSIRLPDSTKSEKRMAATEEHIANQYRYSLRAYLSILYMRIPQNFCIILRGKVVEHRNIAQDLKFPEFILYKPQTGGTKEGEVLTTVGFLKEAPNVHIHGFNVYHKNRLVLPFWPAVNIAANGKGRGVVGVLEADYVEPIHNKQDFEKTSLFQKLEHRLKDMTLEYWDYHCGLIGYQVMKKAREPVSKINSSDDSPNNARHEQLAMHGNLNLTSDTVISKPFGPVVQNFRGDVQQHGTINRHDDITLALRNRTKNRGGKDTMVPVPVLVTQEIQPAAYSARSPNKHAVVVANKKLQAERSEHKKTEEELSHKLSKLTRELEEARHEYTMMFCELQSLKAV